MMKHILWIFLYKMDNLTKEQRRKNMQSIKSANTKSELLLRRALWEKGYRYRKNVKNILGKPDICFIRKKIAVFCDSDFFHGKFYQEGIKIPKTNTDYWIKKFTQNIERDAIVTKELKKMGWTVIRLWETDIKNNLDECVKIIENVLT